MSGRTAAVRPSIPAERYAARLARAASAAGEADVSALLIGVGSDLRYLTGYEAMTIEELRRFRQLNSKTPGHPENFVTPGVETTTGPLGQGVATSVGALAGTMGYMAPEQVRGITVDHRADIFAFGAVLYEMLCGARAFGGDTVLVS